MGYILEYFRHLNFNPNAYLTASGILLIGSIVLGLVGRFAFGRKSILNISVSSSFGILFIYGLSVIIASSEMNLSPLAAPLPFVTVSGNALLLIDFYHAPYTSICSEILSMIILAFLVNLADSLLPKPKNVVKWIFFRLLTILIGYLLHLSTVWLFETYLPNSIVTYAPIVLLAILALMLMTGSLKIVIGALISTSNPIVGALYTFFFANIIGKQITKAVLTTAIIIGLIVALQYAGISSIAISAAAILPYLPVVILLLVMWYLLCCIL